MRVQSDTAKLAKEKGFPVEEVYARVFKNSGNIIEPYQTFRTKDDCDNAYKANYYLNCPKDTCQIGYPTESKLIYYNLTQSELQTWLRDVHKIQIEIEAAWNQEMTEIIGYYCFKYKTWSEKVEIVFKDMEHFDTYEQALEVALLESLKSI